MNVHPLIKANLSVAASFCTILTLMFFLFATQWDLAALEQTVNNDRCKNAKVKLAQYEAIVLQSSQPASLALLEAIADLNIIIEESCPK